MNDPRSEDGLERSLAALPRRPADAVVAERMRLRAKMALRRPGRSTWARAWYVAEPWLVGVVVIAFLGWTFERVALLLG